MEKNKVGQCCFLGNCGMGKQEQRDGEADKKSDDVFPL